MTASRTMNERQFYYLYSSLLLCLSVNAIGALRLDKSLIPNNAIVSYKQNEKTNNMFTVLVIVDVNCR